VALCPLASWFGETLGGFVSFRGIRATMDSVPHVYPNKSWVRSFIYIYLESFSLAMVRTSMKGDIQKSSFL
jgi:hypothetical protein